MTSSFGSLDLQANKLIYLQTSFIAVAVLAVQIFCHWQASISVLSGGCSWLIPTILFVLIVKSTKISSNSSVILRNFLLAEVLKLFTSGILIVLLLQFQVIQTLFFLGGYMIAVMSAFLLPIVWRHKTDG